MIGKQSRGLNIVALDGRSGRQFADGASAAGPEHVDLTALTVSVHVRPLRNVAREDASFLGGALCAPVLVYGFARGRPKGEFGQVLKHY